jgi:hypothetical protein
LGPLFRYKKRDLIGLKRLLKEVPKVAPTVTKLGLSILLAATLEMKIIRMAFAVTRMVIHLKRKMRETKLCCAQSSRTSKV